MHLGYIGLGKMGLGMVTRLSEKGYTVVAYDSNHALQNDVEKIGARFVTSLKDLVSTLPVPRTVWIMVPHQFVDVVLNQLIPLLSAGDTIIEGGNSPYKQTIERKKMAENLGIHFLDAGVSGGPGGARSGACIMVGGQKEVYTKYIQLFTDLSVKDGYGYMGQSGSGHFVKMIHNGIEYGMMQAIAEGFGVMHKSDFKLDLEEVVKVYTHGSVIESRLISWLQKAYKEYGIELSNISGKVSHSGEGQWTVDVARELNIEVPIIEGSLQFRKESQEKPSYIGKVVSALRNQFGGHKVNNE